MNGLKNQIVAYVFLSSLQGMRSKFALKAHAGRKVPVTHPRIAPLSERARAPQRHPHMCEPSKDESKEIFGPKRILIAQEPYHRR